MRNMIVLEESLLSTCFHWAAKHVDKLLHIHSQR